MRKKAFAARVWAKLMAHEKRERLFKPGAGILAAVSGGPDSVCLAHYLVERRKRLGFRLELAYVDHGLRPQAAREARFVRDLGRRWGVGVSVLRVNAAEGKARRQKGLEEACRVLRYKALAARAKKRNLDYVAVAHHMDDQAETVLLNLLRGTRISALGAMPPRRRLSKKTLLIRPLLALKRAEVLEYLKIHGLKFRIDATNRDVRLTRNWIRRKVFPLLESRNPRIREHLSGIAAQVRGRVRQNIL